MKNLTTIKALLFIALMTFGCSSSDDLVADNPTTPPVIVDPNNPNNPNPALPVLDPTKPVVFETTNTSVGAITSTSAVINDNNTLLVSSTLSMSNVVKVGVCYSFTNPTPTVADTKVEGVINAEKTKFATKVSDTSLSNKKLYARTYVVNSDGTTVYGDPVNLSTVKLVRTSLSVTSISKTGAIVGGEGIIDATEPSKVTEHGVCWSETNKLPTKADSWAISFNDVVIYNVGLTSLKHNTVYYYRAFVKNSTGVFYASEVYSFRTVEVPPYDVIINAVDAIQTKESDGINYPSLKVYMGVNSCNGEVIKEAGVIMSKTPGVTIENASYTKSESLSITVSFPTNTYTDEILFHRLTPTTTFYIKSYIKTNSGTYYSTERTEKTGLGQL